MTTDVDERELKMEQMRADIGNKLADTDYKRGLLRYEPWKVAFAGFAAGGAFVAALVAALVFAYHLGGKL